MPPIPSVQSDEYGKMAVYSVAIYWFSPLFLFSKKTLNRQWSKIPNRCNALKEGPFISHFHLKIFVRKIDAKIAYYSHSAQS